ncbi:MAG TPA: Nramp family divalent metal transporter [Pyrinomonadaceae bacterium]|nr:Nramp family divalent metal transporter [Pyrinomonadaceae bacterium]
MTTPLVVETVPPQSQSPSPAPEAQSGLDPWRIDELPPAPVPRGFGWFSAVGPGVIALGVSIGSGEFLLGPAAFVKYGLSLLWVVGVAALLQTLLNLEVMRYTLATGEPVFTGFMRTRPHSTFWAWFYSILFFLQMGWPGWAGAAAGALFFLWAKRLPGGAETGTVYLIGVGLFLMCGLILMIGRRIERTLEYLNWIMVSLIIGGLGLLALMFVPAYTWLAALAGFAGFDLNTGNFQFVPAGADFFLIGAFAAYAGGGGVANLTLSNWARDKGYGMSSRVGFIPAAVGGKKVSLAHSGSTFKPDRASLERWKGWWRIVRVDQWGVYFTGAILGMALPALLYVTFVAAGSEIRGLGIAAALAQAVSTQKGALFGGAIAVLGVWILFKTQLDILDAMTRAITDILWTGSARIRRWRGGDVRVVYYTTLAVISLWGILAMRLTQPIVLLALGANMAGIVFIISSIHLLYVNTRLLPVELRPSLWRRFALVALAIFYGFFLTMWVWSSILKSS